MIAWIGMGDRGCCFVVGSVIRLLMREKGGGRRVVRRGHDPSLSLLRL